MNAIAKARAAMMCGIALTSVASIAACFQNSLFQGSESDGVALQRFLIPVGLWCVCIFGQITALCGFMGARRIVNNPVPAAISTAGLMRLAIVAVWIPVALPLALRLVRSVLLSAPG